VKEIKIPRHIMQKYLEKIENKPIKIKTYKRLGSGWHGTGYSIVYIVGKKEKKVILRTIRPEGFSHDYKADRAKVFILQHELSKKIPLHIKSLDVGGYTKHGSLVSLGNCEEFFQIVEVAEGREYFDYINEIKERGKLSKEDRKKALLLSNYLVNLHKNKFRGKKEIADSLYRRHLRDCVGGGEMLMGVLDTYPERLKWTNIKEITEIITRAVELREEIKHMSYRLCRIHGDFHPGNILFYKDKFTVLDASREEFGDPTDDLTALSINYLWYALQQNNRFSGIFIELFNLFWNNYLRKTNDKAISHIAPIFFAFRGVVVAHPLFYPNQSNETRKKIFKFIKNILKDKEFNINKLNDYLK